MEVLDSIRTNFSKGFFGKAMKIEGLPDRYPAWTLKQMDSYGVAVKMDRKLDFSERFSTARIWTSNDSVIDGQKADYLLLTCSDVEMRNEFATICSQFVETGEDGALRKRLIDDPAVWWRNWKALIGNVQSDQEVYSKLGELMVVEELLRKGKHPKWSGIESATHDVELDDQSYEVKSTNMRYGYEVEISSIYQMKKERKALSLVFLRFERSHMGNSLNDVIENVVHLGYSRDRLENVLAKAGLEKGCTARLIKYKLLEMRVYPVDESFPRLTLKSFVGEQLPPNVIKVEYSVDLSGVPRKATLQRNGVDSKCTSSLNFSAE